MIVVFPMLTSSSVSSNILPGICKMLEKHILLHNMDEILKKVKTNADIERLGMSLRLRESEITEQGTDSGGGNKPQPDISVPNVNIPIGQGGGKPKPKTDVGTPKVEQTLALEPTWVKVETRDGHALLGVKVVPFPVASDEQVIKLMISDKSLSFWKRLVQSNLRNVIRRLHRAKRYFGKFVGYQGGSLTGDPKKDIVFAMTNNRQNVLTLLDHADLEDDEMLRDIGGIQKLFQLGWTSFAVADDTAAKVTFCMRQFKGTCAIIPYKMIYSALGTEPRKVYDDLEDIKQKSGAIFRAKTNVRKVFGEAMIQSKINKYQNVSESTVMNFANSLKTSGKSISKTLEVASKKGDKNAFDRALSRVPKMNIGQVERYCEKMSSNFKMNHAVSQVVLKNSVKSMPKDLARAVSCVLSLGTSIMPGDPKKNNKKALKMFVTSARSNFEVGIEAWEKAKEALNDLPDQTSEEGIEFTKNITKEWLSAIVNAMGMVVNILIGLWESAIDSLPGEEGDKTKETIKSAPSGLYKVVTGFFGAIGSMILFAVSNPVVGILIIVGLVFILIAWLSRNA